MNKAELEKRITNLEIEVVRLQKQIYRLQGGGVSISTNPYDLNATRIR